MQTNNINTHYPLPEGVVKKYVHDIFEPIKHGECVTTIWVANAGRRLVNKFIIENMSLFADIMPDYDNYIFSYIEPLDLTDESLSGYLRLIGKTLITDCQKKKCGESLSKSDIEAFDDEQSGYSKLLTALNSVMDKIIKCGHEVVLFIGEFDELNFVDKLFCNNLRSIWSKYDGKLHYVFLIKEVRMVFEKSKIGEDLAENFLQNVVYFPISAGNSRYLVDHFSDRFNHQFSAEELGVLTDVCDGHPYFLKVACSYMAKAANETKLTPDKLSETLRQNYELRAVAKRIIDVQTDKAQEKLKAIAQGKVNNLEDDELETLEKLGLAVKDASGYYKPFSVIFKDAILERSLNPTKVKSDDADLVYDSQRGAILYQGKPIEEKFTPQEYEVLRYLMGEPNKLRSRDEIGNILWGKDSYDKYSDWAIDQLMSKLRKKLNKLGLEKGALITIRGKGYKIVS